MKRNSQRLDCRDVPDPSEPGEIADIRNHPDNYLTFRNKLIRRTTRNSTLSVMASFISLVLALLVLAYTTRTQKRLTERALQAQQELTGKAVLAQRDLKEIDLRQNFLKRYEEIVFDEKEKVKALRARTPKEIQVAQKKAFSYYHRFWDLQLEEYQFRCDNLIDQRIYASWMDFRRGEYRDDDNLQGVTYQKGWEEAKRYFLDREPSRAPYYEHFTEFMEKVFQGETQAEPNCPK